MAHKSLQIKMDWDFDLNPTAFWYFDGFVFYTFCLTGFGFDNWIWTSSQLSVQFRNYIDYCIANFVQWNFPQTARFVHCVCLNKWFSTGRPWPMLGQ